MLVEQGIPVETVTLARMALQLAGRGRWVCAICSSETDDATLPCPWCGAPDVEHDVEPVLS